MSSEELIICRCDYCGHVFETGESRIHIYGSDDAWVYAELIDCKVVKEKAVYELDFCNSEHAKLWLEREL